MTVKQVKAIRLALYLICDNDPFDKEDQVFLYSLFRLADEQLVSWGYKTFLWHKSDAVKEKSHV